MGKYFLHISFALTMTLYFLTRWIRPHVDIAFVKYYLTDLYFVPAMCLFSLFFVRLLKQDRKLQIPVHYVFMQVAIVAFYFEWYLPNYKGRIGWYTADPWDIVMYIIGGFLFILWQRWDRLVNE